MRQDEFKRKFLVHTKEIHRRTYYVEAIEPAFAKVMVDQQEPNDGETEMHIMHCDDTFLEELPSLEWSVEEVDEAPPG